MCLRTRAHLSQALLLHVKVADGLLERVDVLDLACGMGCMRVACVAWDACAVLVTVPAAWDMRGCELTQQLTP